MSLDDAKAKLSQLTAQIKNHNKNFKTYTAKKKQVLDLIKEIYDLVTRIVSMVGENTSAAKNLKELITSITSIPAMDGELTETELDDVMTELQKVKDKLIEITGNIDKDKNEWHHGTDEAGNVYWYNKETGATAWNVPPGGTKIEPGNARHEPHPADVRPPPSESGSGGGESKSSGLPSGWRKEKTEDGQTYYISPDGVSQWDPPSSRGGRRRRTRKRLINSPLRLKC